MARRSGCSSAPFSGDRSAWTLVSNQVPVPSRGDPGPGRAAREGLLRRLQPGLSLRLAWPLWAG